MSNSLPYTVARKDVEANLTTFTYVIKIVIFASPYCKRACTIIFWQKKRSTYVHAVIRGSYTINIFWHFLKFFSINWNIHMFLLISTSKIAILLVSINFSILRNEKLVLCMTNGKNYFYWPNMIILAYMIILISKTDNPTRLFHSARLFGSAE